MKAILTVVKTIGKEKVEEKLLFDTEKSRKICDVLNDFRKPIAEIYISSTGILFREKDCKLHVLDQEKAKEYIGENYPEKYIEFFGDVKEA